MTHLIVTFKNEERNFAHKDLNKQGLGPQISERTMNTKQVSHHKRCRGLRTYLRSIAFLLLCFCASVLAAESSDVTPRHISSEKEVRIRAKLVDMVGNTVELYDVDPNATISLDLLKAPGERYPRSYGKVTAPIHRIISVRTDSDLAEKYGLHAHNVLVVMRFCDGTEVVGSADKNSRVVVGKMALGTYTATFGRLQILTFMHDGYLQLKKGRKGVCARVTLKSGKELSLAQLSFTYHWRKYVISGPDVRGYYPQYSRTEVLPVLVDNNRIQLDIPFAYMKAMRVLDRSEEGPPYKVRKSFSSNFDFSLTYQIPKSQSPVSILGTIGSLGHDSMDYERITGVDGRGTWEVSPSLVVSIDRFIGKKAVQAPTKEQPSLWVCETWNGMKWEIHTLTGPPVIVEMAGGYLDVDWSKIAKLVALQQKDRDIRLDLTTLDGKNIATKGTIRDRVRLFGTNQQGLEGVIAGNSIRIIERVANPGTPY